MAIINAKNQNIDYLGPTDLFISYSHKDKNIVLKIMERLSSLGYSVIYDSSIPGGEDWVERVEDIMHVCKGALFILTEHSLFSEAVLKEITYASDIQENYSSRFAMVPVLLNEEKLEAICERLDSTKTVREKKIAQGIRRKFNNRIKYIVFDGDFNEEIVLQLNLLNIEPSAGNNASITDVSETDIDVETESSTASSGELIDETKKEIQEIQAIASNHLSTRPSKNDKPLNTGIRADRKHLKLIEEYKSFMKDGRYAKAEALLVKLMTIGPKDNELRFDYIKCILGGKYDSDNPRARVASNFLLECLKEFDKQGDKETYLKFAKEFSFLYFVKLSFYADGVLEEEIKAEGGVFVKMPNIGGRIMDLWESDDKYLYETGLRYQFFKNQRFTQIHVYRECKLCIHYPDGENTIVDVSEKNESVVLQVRPIKGMRFEYFAIENDRLITSMIDDRSEELDKLGIKILFGHHNQLNLGTLDVEAIYTHKDI